MHAYYLLLALSALIIFSYLFDIISYKLRIPSVILLIGTGIAIKYFLEYQGIPLPDMHLWVSILGLIGLLLIVLEAALDLKLSKDKLPIIVKAFFTALIILLLTSFAIAGMILYLGLTEDFYIAFLNAIPLSVVSSAIVIPSVMNLDEEKREFLIYESTFSDILGILLFDIVLRIPEAGKNVVMHVGVGMLATILISLLAGYVLIFLFEQISTKVKFFLFLSILTALFVAGKLLHLSSLILILIFGLMLENYDVFFPKFLRKFYKREKIEEVKEQFKLITFETAFLVRTVFFVVFGLTIDVKAMGDPLVLVIGSLILMLTFLVRFINLKMFYKSESIFPEVFMAPRGLITVLLYFKIPEEYRIEGFKEVISFVILGSAFLMMIGLLISGKKTTKEEFEFMEKFDHGAFSEEDIAIDRWHLGHPDEPEKSDQ
ncbi:MAG: sodium:proton exchanger [Chlorobi bacterium]|nr:sodium:proton exchanger [Chlorobiota bacterium]